MSDSTPPRPGPVTVAGALIILGSVMVVFSAFQQMGQVQSLATRESVETFLSEPPGDSLNLAVQDVLSLLRILSMVSAACATAAGIFGVYALRRSTTARLGLTILAVPIFLTGLVTGGFMSAVVAAASVMLWMQPARDWFNGITPPSPAKVDAAARRSEAAAAPPRDEAPRPQVGASVSGEPRPYDGFGQPVATAPVPGPQAGWAPVTPSARPRAVTLAAVFTWVGAGLSTIGLIITGAVFAASPDRVIDQVREQNPEAFEAGITDNMLVATSLTIMAVFVLWCLAACTLAWLVVRRTGWARIVLIVSAAIAALMCVGGVLIGAWFLLAPLAACVGATSMLSRVETRAWFESR